MSTNKDFRSELEMWQDMWDAAQEEGIHPPIQKVQPAPYSAGHTAQDTYYDYLDTAEEDADAEGLLQEDKFPNPVYVASVGPDHEDPKPVWVSEDLLSEVEKLKNRLFEVENRLARMGQGKKWSEKVVTDDGKKLMNEIKSLRQRIEKISSTLGIGDEPGHYQWQFKKD